MCFVGALCVEEFATEVFLTLLHNAGENEQKVCKIAILIKK